MDGYTLNRIAAKYACKAECTLYSKVKRIKTYMRTTVYETTLYYDADCTEVAYTIVRSSSRPMKSGVFKIENPYRKFKKFVYVVCVDNGVRRGEVIGVKYKYNYEK